MPKVSVIVPIYKVEAFLDRCLNSLINQSLTDIEIILVDDGSPDNCPAICDRYAKQDERIRVIHKENGGVSAARNDGLAAARGEWVLFCDSDDWMELNALESLYTVGEKEKTDVVVGDIYRIKGNETIYNQFFANEFTYRDRKDMDNLVMADLHQNYCPIPPKTAIIGYGGPWNKLIRRQILIEKGICFDTSLFGIFDDILFTAYVYANMSSITYIQKPVYDYVVVATSITKSFNNNALIINEHIFLAFENFIAQYAPDGKWDKAYYALVIRRFEEVLRLYFFSKRNPKKLYERLTELKNVMKQEPYVTAAKNVESDKLLSHQRKAAFFLKIKSAIGLWLLYWFKSFLGRV